MKNSHWWLGSIFTSLLLLIVLVWQWWQMNTYHVEPTQLTTQTEADQYLTKNWQQNSVEPLIKIKTGIFIQSLEFYNSSDVNITGYLWQKFDKQQLDLIQQKKLQAGFILPEQVDSGSAIEPKEIYRLDEGDQEVVGWYFEATLRQPFDYSKYPFDHNTVWVRIWPKSFYQNVVLVPDYEAYDATGLEDIFGIEESIVLGTWERMNTYFDYKLFNYDTNFGIPNYIGQNGFPELHYNFVVKRKFENAFIIYLLPLFLVAVLLFAALLTTSEEQTLVEKLGFNTSGFIAASSALFFVVMLAHIQLRETFVSNSIVYLEYFYILMYGVLVVTTANAYLLAVYHGCGCRFLRYRDNLLPKVAYWPSIFLCMILLTVWVNHS